MIPNTYKILNELEEKLINKQYLNKLSNTRQNNINNSKATLKKYGINTKNLDSELDDFVNKTLKGQDHNIDKHLEILTNHLKNELDNVNDNKLVKIVILNMIVYSLNYLVYFILLTIFKKLKIPKANTVSIIITSFIVSPITDEVAFKVEEKGGYESSIFSKYGSRIITGLIHKLISHPIGINNQIIISLMGITINQLKLIFKDELDIPILETTIMGIRKAIYNCYLIIFKFIKLFGSLIPGGGTGR